MSEEPFRALHSWRGHIVGRLLAVFSLVLLPFATLLASSASAAPLAGFGDPIAVWQSHFHQDTNNCDASNCYGPRIVNSSNRYEFSYVRVARGKVDGFDVALRRGTTLLKAELQIATLFPSDVQMGSVTIVHRDALGNSCAMYNLQSKSVERIFGSRAFGSSHGTVGVELAHVLPNGATRYSINAVNLALVVPTYLGYNANC
jgi:hypothetical protein